MTTLTDSLKAAIKASGRTSYAIEKECGVSRIVIDRFLSGERGITLETAGKIAGVLGVKLTKASRKA